MVKRSGSALSRTPPADHDDVQDRNVRIVTMLRIISAQLAGGNAIIQASEPDARFPFGLARSDLDQLIAEGLLVAEFHRRCLVCPLCGTDSLILSETCVACGSQDMSSSPLGYHYDCAAVFPVISGKRHLRHCPKCGVDLSVWGDTFEECGQVYHCCTCGHDSPEAATQVECSACQWYGDANDAPLVRLERLSLTDNARRLIEGTPA